MPETGKGFLDSKSDFLFVQVFPKMVTDFAIPNQSKKKIFVS